MIETSIIIPVRNQKETLLAALDSLKKQIRKPRVFEIVICDDDSTDGTGDTVKKLHYPLFFKYFVNKPAIGRAANRDQGAIRSAGKRMIFIDGDMVPGSTFIEGMLNNGNSDSVKVGRVLPPPEEKLDGIEKYLYSRGRYNITEDGSEVPANYFTSNNFSISRDHYLKIGGFDTKFEGWGGEDIDFGLRLKKKGIEIKYSAKAVTYHHHKRTLKDMVLDFREFGNLTFAYLIEKHPEFLDQIDANRLGLPDSKGEINTSGKLMSSILLNKPVHGLVYNLVSSMKNHRWPDSVYDYLLWGSLALGYKKRAKR